MFIIEAGNNCLSVLFIFNPIYSALSYRHFILFYKNLSVLSFMIYFLCPDKKGIFHLKMISMSSIFTPSNYVVLKIC